MRKLTLTAALILALSATAAPAATRTTAPGPSADHPIASVITYLAKALQMRVFGGTPTVPIP
jgi:hypothetical protein